MSAWLDAVRAWWAAGDAAMPVLLLVALALYALLIERTWVLAGLRRRRYAGQVSALLASHPERRAWAQRTLALAEAADLGRSFAAIRILIAVLPLIGLLGTVTGMVGTFAALSAGSAVGTGAAAGISLALAATQYALALAVPALAWERMLQARATRLTEARELALRVQEPTP